MQKEDLNFEQQFFYRLSFSLAGTPEGPNLAKKLFSSHFSIFLTLKSCVLLARTLLAPLKIAAKWHSDAFVGVTSSKQQFVGAKSALENRKD